MTDARHTYIPQSGPMKRPKSREQAAAMLADSAFDAPDVQEITFHTNELTSECPISGQPDFGTLTITYEPDKLALESKSVKFYVWALRSEPAFCEALAATIADDVNAAIKPKSLTVTVTQNTRGGLALTATAER